MGKIRYAIIGPHMTGKISNMLVDAFKRKNIPVNQIIPSKAGLLFPSNTSQQWLLNEQYNPIEIPDIAIVRGVGSKTPSKIFFRLDWMWILERMDVRLVNSRACLEIATDKMLTTQALIKRGIPTPQTVMCESAPLAIKVFEHMGGDVVVKPLFGACGNGIFRISNIEMAKYAFGQMELNEEIYYIQRFMEHQNEDYRLLVVGDKVLCGMKRKANNWKTNIAQGGKAISINPSEEFKKLAIESTQAVEGEIIGVDLMETSEGIQVIEVNSVPGYAGLQTVTPFNISDRIVDYLLTLKK